MPTLEQTPPAAIPTVATNTGSGFVRLLVRVMLFVAPIAVFLLLFEGRFKRLNPSHFAAKKMLLENRAAMVETLILGSSHALTGVDPTVLGGRAFNLASQSQSLYYDAALIRKYRPNLPALKRVILPVSYFSLEYQLEDGPERWRAFHYRYFYGLAHRDWHNLVSARNFSAYFLSGETTRARVLLGSSTNALDEYDQWGGWTNRLCGSRLQAMPQDTNALHQAALGTLRLHHGMMKPEHSSENFLLLDHLIGELRHTGIEVVLVTLPVTQYYTAGVQPEAYDRLRQLLATLSAKHGVPYLNWMEDTRFDLADFADGDHLNCEGAAKLSRYLKEALGL